MFEKVKVLSYGDNTMRTIESFIFKCASSSSACYDAFVEMGMVEATVVAALTCTTGVHKIMDAMFKYPTWAPIHRFAIVFPDLWRKIEDNPDCSLFNVFRNIIDVVSQYSRGCQFLACYLKFEKSFFLWIMSPCRKLY